MIGIAVLTATIVVLSSLFCYLYETYSRKHRLASQFPGPPTLPFFGNSLDFFKRSNEEVQKLLTDWHKTYGKLFRVKIFDLNAFNVADPKVIEMVLSNNTKNLTKNRLYNFLKPWLGEGLLISTGKKWHNRRKILTPAFHFNILEQFVKVFDRQSQILVQNLQKHNDGKVFDIHPYITLMTLDVICETAMGTKINAQTNSQNAYVKAVAEITNVISLRFAKVWQRYELLFRLFASGQKKKLDKNLKVLHDFTISIILKRRQDLLEVDEPYTSENVKEHEDNNIQKLALLDLLLKSSIDGKPLSNQDIREEVDTFMFEGHDTTTSGIIFTLYMISRHKDVQDKLFGEIRSVIGDNPDTPITYRHLQELKYIELVIKESFRFYPPVPGIGRTLDEDVQLDDGRILPTDSSFNLMFFLMFKDSDYFADPERFDPERFRSGEANDLMNSYTFIPFSAGSRNCIGQRFAMLEIKSTISKILRYYELLPLGEAPITSMELVLRTKNGVQMGLRNRTYD